MPTRPTLAILVVALLTAACGQASSGAPVSASAGRIDGQMALFETVHRSGGQCAGTNGYEDFGSGMQVVVKDEGGQVIATTNTQLAPVPPQLQAIAFTTCIVKFSLDGLPVATFYTIDVGGRGEFTYSAEELATTAGKFKYLLGSAPPEAAAWLKEP